jgi:2-polyprenyl-6-hydroxyphenyl methylase/3-demethylubiquinone-9 3-methyltransferase
MKHARAAARTMWALGDYHRFALSTVWQLGPTLVSACGVSAGQRVLDVAAGTGNVAIRAAQRGASVVASDLTPENFGAGRRAALDAGVDLDWVEGDAAARELLRVCVPGGVVGMMNFTPRGAGGDFFRVLSAYAPPAPAGALPPLLWGTEDHVRQLCGDGVQSLSMSRHEYVETAAGAREYLDLFKQAFGPMVAIYESLDKPARGHELDGAFLEFIARWNRGSAGRVEIPYEYLLVVARKRA